MHSNTRLHPHPFQLNKPFIAVALASALSLPLAHAADGKACIKVPDGQQTVSHAAKYLALEVGPLEVQGNKTYVTLDYRPRNDACIANVSMNGQDFRGATRRCDEKKWTRNLKDDIPLRRTADYAALRRDSRAASFASEAPYMFGLEFGYDSTFGQMPGYIAEVYYKDCGNCATGKQIVYMCV